MTIINTFGLAGKNALVTGSSRGIGRAIAIGLAEQGSNVVFNCATTIKLAEAAAAEARNLGVKAIAVQADMTQSESPANLYNSSIEFFGHIDILVLNVSVQGRTYWDEITKEEFDWQMMVNIHSAMRLMQLAVPGMVKREWGRIITIGSIQQGKPHPNMFVYAASKSAVVNMVKNLAWGLAKHNITFNNIAPGVILTDRTEEPLSDPRYRQVVLDQIPSRTFGEPEDCVGAALLLSSEAGRYINGINLWVDGGTHLCGWNT